ncbi:hypothetical protein FRC11_013974 [Ceratobasidium sp. 423]|nr:hypothetical protein FRC11_013974 [Ceratobasidium sp. 423]
MNNLASLRFSQVRLPLIHLENIYINVGDHLERPLATELIPWTHSEQFRHNTTSRPVIVALFTPFSAMNWLSFNSTSLKLTGHAPFAPISYNVSVTLAPGFVDKAEELAIPIHFNNTPMTFTTSSFSVCVLGEQPASSETKAWIPYLVIALLIIALISFFSALVTCCCWQDMCHRDSGPRLGEIREEADSLGGKENKSTRKKSLGQLGNLETAWPAFAKASNHQGFTRVTPYDIFKPSSISLRLANLHTVKQERFTQAEAQTPAIYKSIQYAHIPAGSSFAYRLKICRAASHSAGLLINIRAHAEPRSPEWIRFCPETMVIWGTIPEEITQVMPDGLDILILSGSLGYPLARLRMTIPTGSSANALPASGRFVSLFEDGTRSETVNGVDILYIPPDTKYCVKYYPQLLQGPVREGRYRFCSLSGLPPWLTLNPHRLELSGNTMGRRSIDHTDLLLLDSYTQREVARLRIIVLDGHLRLLRA